ncbi:MULTISPECIES: hypothetical protein [unclassified Duganella]|uniref:hypothetical protein n=1 Tax=unclassified Duganella TaxID=2636909 RepID=UPI0018F3999F|nr:MULTISPECIES: hypothetical protein [unclassified Duganella]
MTDEDFRAQERSMLTREAMTAVHAGHVIDHQTVQAWADSLGADNPLLAPFVRNEPPLKLQGIVELDARPEMPEG